MKPTINYKTINILNSKSTISKLNIGVLKTVINSIFIIFLLVSFSSFSVLKNKNSLKDNLGSKTLHKETFEINDDKDGVKISLPNKKAYYQGDKEITKNMQTQIRELFNPTLNQPNMEISDLKINSDFYNDYTITSSNTLFIDGDIEINMLFLIQQLGIHSPAFYQIADNQINENFYLDLFSKPNQSLNLAADTKLTLNFFKENAE